MSKRIRRIHTATNFLKVTAFVVAGISFFIGVLFTGEATSPEGESLQFKLLFLFFGIMAISFSASLLIEKFQYSKYMFAIESKDFERRAAKISSIFQKEREIEKCLISVGKSSPKAIRKLNSAEYNAIRELREEYYTL